MMPEANSRQGTGTRGAGGSRFFIAACLHRAWQVSMAVTLATGIFHLLNLIGTGRAGFGPTLITFFRASFILSWALLMAGWAVEKRLPRSDRADYIMGLMILVFLVRGAFTPETFATTLNWILTGAGVFYLVRWGTRTASDVRLIIISIVGSALVVGAFGLIEYAMKSNPLFDSIQIHVIGADSRVAASDQFYRIRSLVGHPGFVGAILLASAPLAMLAFWRRRWLLAGSLLLLFTGLFLTFSRGSWIIGLLILLPLTMFRARDWIRRNLRWVLPLAILPVAIIFLDYVNQDEVSARLGSVVRERGLHWVAADGPILHASGEADGVQSYTRFIYFDVADDFYFGGGQGPVTVVINFFDRGLGAVRIDYDSRNKEGGPDDGAYTPTAAINKTDSHKWTTAAFYLKDPLFGGRENSGADFRIVDDDNMMVLSEVTVQKGRLKLPGVIQQQWMSRAGSISTRMSLYPFAWQVLKDNPLGVGLYNTPGTDHHAVDSLPLTWMMEFGWPGLLLLAAMILVVARECLRTWKQPLSPASLLLLCPVIMLLHGSFLMILYDKPSLVLTAAVTALYINIRPWRRGGAVINLSNEDFMV